MKQKGKIWFFVIILLVALLSITSITGLKTTYGDIVTTVLRPLNEINFGSDTVGRVTITLRPKTDTVLDTDKMAAIKTVLQTRLFNMSVSDYTVSVDEKKNEILVSFPYLTGKDVKTPEEIAAALTKTNMFTMRKGDKTDENGNPTEETLSEIIFQSSQITAATATTGTINFLKGEEEYIALELTEDGKMSYSSVFSSIEEGADWKDIKYSFWLDNTMISSVYFEDLYMAYMGAEQAPVVIGNDFSLEFATELAKTLSAGSLAHTLKIEHYEATAPSKAPNGWALIIAGISLAIVSLFLLFAYKMPGFIAIIALLGQGAATIAMITSYFNVFNNHLLTKPGIVAFFLIMGLGAVTNVIICSKLKAGMRSGKKIEVSLKSTFSKKVLSPIIITNILLFILAVVIMGSSATSGGFFASLMTPFFFAFNMAYTTPLFSFGFVLFWGIIFNLIFGLLVSWAMLIITPRIRLFSSPRLYGGLKEGKEPKPTKPAIAVAHYKKFIVLPVLILVAVIACTAIFGVVLSNDLKTGTTITYSYSGKIDTKELLSEADILRLTGGKENEPGLAIESSLKYEDPIYGRTQLEIRLPNTYDVQTIDTLNKILIEKYPDNSLKVLASTITARGVLLKNILRPIVVLLAGLALAWIFIIIQFKRLSIKRGILPILILQLLLIVTVFGVFVVYGMPIGANAIPAILVLCGFSLFSFLVIVERVKSNSALYGKKLSTKETGNLSLAQVRGRLMLGTFCLAVFMLGICMFAWLFGGAQGILPISLSLLIGFIVSYKLTYFFVAPWWIMRQDKK